MSLLVGSMLLHMLPLENRNSARGTVMLGESNSEGGELYQWDPCSVPCVAAFGTVSGVAQ